MKYQPKQTDLDRVKKNFTPLIKTNSIEQQQRIDRLSQDMESLAGVILMSCPPSLEVSLALTELEKVLFLTQHAIVRNEVMQSTEPTSDSVTSGIMFKKEG